VRYPIHITFGYVFPDMIPVVSPAMQLRKVADRDLRPRGLLHILLYLVFGVSFYVDKMILSRLEVIESIETIKKGLQM
jgi:hypothetical protein